MACKRWSFDENHSYSIGEVLNFLPSKNESSGLLIKLTGGYRCWNKFNKSYQEPVTTIDMKCDLNIEFGYPEPLDKYSGIFTFSFALFFLVIFKTFKGSGAQSGQDVLLFSRLEMRNTGRTRLVELVSTPAPGHACEWMLVFMRRMISIFNMET